MVIKSLGWSEIVWIARGDKLKKVNNHSEFVKPRRSLSRLLGTRIDEWRNGLNKDGPEFWYPEHKAETRGLVDPFYHLARRPNLKICCWHLKQRITHLHGHEFIVTNAGWSKRFIWKLHRHRNAPLCCDLLYSEAGNHTCGGEEGVRSGAKATERSKIPDAGHHMFQQPFVVSF